MSVEILGLKIQSKEVESKRFYFLELGSERNYKRVWINPLYFKKEVEKRLNEYNETPGIFRNARVERTEKGNLVIREGSDYLFFVLVKCGYRGESRLNPLGIEKEKVVEFDYFHSPRGNLGVSSCAIISTRENRIKIEWSRSGRLYGQPAKGVSIVYTDGRVESIDDIGLKEIEEIEKV